MKAFAASKAIINKFKGTKVAFRDLPLNHKLAIIWYMAVDGEAWAMPDEYLPSFSGWSWAKMKRIREFLKKNISHFDKEYGHLKFGIVNVPMPAFSDMVYKVASTSEDHNENEKSFKDMNRRYLSESPCPIHTELGWPAILNCSENDHLLIEDGWHRMNVYFKKKVKVMPLVY